MQVLYERCAGVDIGKDVIAVAVRLPGEGPDVQGAYGGSPRECRLLSCRPLG